MSYTPGQAKSIRLTASIATVLHGLMIFSFVAAGTYSASQQLQREVTLAVFNKTERPDNADFIAPEDQIGSGELQDSEQLASNQLALAPDEEVKEILLAPDSTALTQLKSSQRTTAITTISNSPYYTIVDEQFEVDESSDDTEKTPEVSIADLSLQIASLEAKLLDEPQLKSKKPRTKVITSTTTLASRDAAYLHQWRDRIETVGNLHYPEQARKESLFGDVRLLVKLQASGLVEEIKVLASSGSSVLDSAAIESVRLAAPFEPFGESLAAEYSRLDIIRTWQFRKNRVSAVAQPR